MTGQDLPSMLREIPVPATRITAEQAIVLGRKATQRRRRGITAGAAAAVVAATAGGFTLAHPAQPPAPLAFPSPSPSPSPSAVPKSAWTATSLTLPDGTTGARVNAMDSSGRFIAGTAGLQAVLWDNLSPRLLPGPRLPATTW